MTKTTTATLTYLHSFGVHQLVTRDSNAYLPGTYQYGSTTLTGPAAQSILGIVNEYFPEAVFKQNQMILNVNARISPNFSVFGFYNLSFANTDGRAGDSLELLQPQPGLRPRGFRLAQHGFHDGQLHGPWAIRFNPFHRCAVRQAVQHRVDDWI